LAHHAVVLAREVQPLFDFGAVGFLQRPALNFECELDDVFAREGAVELLFELALQINNADEGIFGAGVADFAADFVVKFG